MKKATDHAKNVLLSGIKVAPLKYNTIKATVGYFLARDKMNSKQFLKDALIVFPSNEGKSEICDFLYQTSRILAKKNLVIVLNIQKAKSLKEIISDSLSHRSGFQLIKNENDIYYFTPILVLPFRRFPIIVSTNIVLNILALRLGIRFFLKKRPRYILWYFFPQLSYIHKYFSKTWQTVYDVIDFYTSPDPKLNQKIIDQKRYLLKEASLVTSISQTLKENYSLLYKRPMFVVPQGFNVGMFTNKTMKGTVPNFSNGKPIIGFIGHLNERLDFKLLYLLIKRNPQWEFVFIGPKETNINVSVVENYQQIEKILNFKNVQWLDQQPKEKIPELIAQFTICMIPYDVNYTFNKYCYPMKIFEYFYSKKPVISTPIEELKKLQPYVTIASTPKDWESEIARLLKMKWPVAFQKAEQSLALANSWQEKISEIGKLISTQTT